MEEDELDELLVHLLTEGLINVEYNEDLEAMISLTDKGHTYYKARLDAFDS
jgi:hypothetical protein